jgi:hypothetical protein
VVRRDARARCQAGEVTRTGLGLPDVDLFFLFKQIAENISTS